MKVVICFQIVSLTYWKTTTDTYSTKLSLLWFAFKLYLWRIEKQHLMAFCLASSVVICFQIVSLTYWKTTLYYASLLCKWLWFAFKLYLWRIEKQLYNEAWRSMLSCDLLSNCIFDVLKNNAKDFICFNEVVVICFQIVSLTYWKTTRRYFDADAPGLWFAFKLYLWRIEKQHYSLPYVISCRCDLLSNCIFDVLKNNKAYEDSYQINVVICFQIVSLTYWKTTDVNFINLYIRLWFAFKLYLWRIEKQRPAPRRFYYSGCDLLSNCIFDVLKNNYREYLKVMGNVVICFQIVSLTYWKTTQRADIPLVAQLWFAFKLYLWRIEKQLYGLCAALFYRCDLLSNCIFDVLKNNY